MLAGLLLRFSKVSVLLFFLVSVVASCQRQGPVAISSGAPGDIENIRVERAQPETISVGDEDFPLPNCGGTGKLTQTLGSQMGAEKQVSLDTTASALIGSEGTIPILQPVRLKLELEVESTYRQAYETAVSRLDSIGMEAAPGTHVIYVIDWEEQRYESSVLFDMEGNTYSVPYHYALRVPKIKDSYNRDCGTDEALSPRVTETAVSAEIAVPTGSIAVVTVVIEPPTTPPDSSPSTPAAMAHTCVQGNHLLISSSWKSGAEFSPAGFDDRRVYSHCPPANTVQYGSIAVDDILEKVEKVCTGSVTEIGNAFTPYNVPGQILTHYRSERIDLAPDCRIDFTIKDDPSLGGENIGLQIKDSQP